MKFFDYKFILVLGLSMVVYLIYQELERLIKRVARLEQKINHGDPNNKISSEQLLPLPQLVGKNNIINVPISTNSKIYNNQVIKKVDYSNEGNIYSNDTSANEQDTMLLESITNMTKNAEIETDSCFTTDSLPKLLHDLAMSNDNSVSVYKLSCDLTTSDDKSDSIPKLSCKLATSDDKSDSIPKLSCELATSDDKSDSIPKLSCKLVTNNNLPTSNDNSVSVPKLVQTLATSNDNSVSVPKLVQTLATSNDNSVSVPKLVQTLATSDNLATSNDNSVSVPKLAQTLATDDDNLKFVPKLAQNTPLLYVDETKQISLNNLSKKKLTELQEIAQCYGISITTDDDTKKKTRNQLLQEISSKK